MALKNLETIRTAAKVLAQQTKSDVVLFSGPCFPTIEQVALPKLRARQKDADHPASAIWVLVTPGGIPDVAYRITRAMQATYKQTTALVGGWCKSAGTLCVIGASELAMSDEGELGPLDIQLARRDEIDERDSGLVIDQALETLERHAFAFFDSFMRQMKESSNGLVTLKLASDISSNITKGLFEPLYRQIDPQKIGEVTRSMELGKAYALRLNMPNRNLRPRMLENLLTAYPSHGFVIDRVEAAHIFQKVRPPTTEEAKFLVDVGDFALYPRGDTTPHFEIVTYEARDEAPSSNESDESKDATGTTPRGSEEGGAASPAANRRVRRDGRPAPARAKPRSVRP